MQAKRAQCESGNDSDFRVSSDGCLMFHDKIFVPKDDKLIRKILHEAHSGCLSVHLGSTKMYNDLKKLYWWPDMERDISDRASSTLGVISTGDGSRVKVGSNRNGFCNGVTYESKKERCCVGYCG
ncbi:reverse transcriptase [Gossypium australe]|uniref:Reverse transcriptase n=1 Tax=Gossypium australe TaxID=47621 RepID=A0A5B6UU38_9ROSI|nr:reverse transcriptase [Gossypium australe]